MVLSPDAVQVGDDVPGVGLPLELKLTVLEVNVEVTVTPDGMDTVFSVLPPTFTS
ncbi:MAG: hypothetical protein HY660_09930 [Armatimonadetes bacterium]|nr:hypothetical protein [Armatimonadota bacterium]